MAITFEAALSSGGRGNSSASNTTSVESLAANVTLQDIVSNASADAAVSWETNVAVAEDASQDTAKDERAGSDVASGASSKSLAATHQDIVEAEPLAADAAHEAHSSLGQAASQDVVETEPLATDAAHEAHGSLGQAESQEDEQEAPIDANDASVAQLPGQALVKTDEEKPVVLGSADAGYDAAVGPPNGMSFKSFMARVMAVLAALVMIGGLLGGITCWYWRRQSCCTSSEDKGPADDRRAAEEEGYWRDWLTIIARGVAMMTPKH